MSRKVIVTAALTGAIHTPGMVLGAGNAKLRIAAIAAAMGGHVRVGLEDSLWAGPGVLAESAEQQIGSVASVLDGLGLAMAKPDDAREMLGLKGPGEVNF